MDLRALLNKASNYLGAAELRFQANKKDKCHAELQGLLDFLIEKLVGSPPGTPAAPAGSFNPESVLSNIAIAIKHRCISHTHRWKIIYYHERITCVPAYADIPSQIVLGEFTEKMVQDGFTVVYWNQLKTNVVKLYKELHK